MKQLLAVCVSVLFLGACAGQVPAWWNPSNRYVQPDTPPAVQQPAPAVQKPVIADEPLENLPDESYQEQTIAPLPEEEDMPVNVPAEEPALPAPSVLE